MTDLKKNISATTDGREAPQNDLTFVNADPVQEDQFANLTIKVHRRLRLHWLIEAKKQGTSLTATIIDALNQKFGTPE